MFRLDHLRFPMCVCHFPLVLKWQPFWFFCGYSQTSWLILMKFRFFGYLYCRTKRSLCFDFSFLNFVVFVYLSCLTITAILVYRWIFVWIVMKFGINLFCIKAERRISMFMNLKMCFINNTYCHKMFVVK